MSYKVIAKILSCVATILPVTIVFSTAYLIKKFREYKNSKKN